MRGNRTALIGLAVGLVGAVLLGLFVATTTRERAPEEETVPALVTTAAAGADTPAEQLGQIVRTADVPLSLAPERRITALSDVAGQRLVRAVGPGEILNRDQFVQPGPGAGGFVVPAGYEAISVEVDPAPGVEGYVTPQSKVNVYGILAEQTPTGAVPYTQLLLAQTPVLAVTRGTLTGESQAPSPEQASSTIVLLLQVRPEDVPVLTFAQSQGALWFTIANEEDPPPPAVRTRVDALDPGTRTAEIAEAVAALRAAEEAARAAADAAQQGEDEGAAASPSPTEGGG